MENKTEYLVFTLLLFFAGKNAMSESHTDTIINISSNQENIILITDQKYLLARIIHKFLLPVPVRLDTARSSSVPHSGTYRDARTTRRPVWQI